MKSSISISISVFCLVLIVHSCKLASLDDPIVVVNVEDEFEINLREELSPSTRSLQFLVESIEEENCQNATIAYSFLREGNKLKISLEDILEATDCQEGNGPAKAAVNLGVLSPGVYNLELDLKNTVFNKGQIILDEQLYKVDLHTDNGIKLIRDELRRVPDRAIWGYVNTNEENIADNFLSELRVLATDIDLQDGYYGYFQVEGRQVKVENQPEQGITKPFVYYFDGDSNILQDLVQEFRELHPDKAVITLMDATGTSY